VDGKRIQCWSNAQQHIAYSSNFTVYELYSEILVENCNFFLHPIAFGGVLIGIHGKYLVLRKLESWGYQAVKTV